MEIKQIIARVREFLVVQKSTRGRCRAAKLFSMLKFSQFFSNFPFFRACEIQVSCNFIISFLPSFIPASFTILISPNKRNKLCGSNCAPIGWRERISTNQKTAKGKMFKEISMRNYVCKIFLWFLLFWGWKQIKNHFCSD